MQLLTVSKAATIITGDITQHRIW